MRSHEPPSKHSSTAGRDSARAEPKPGIRPWPAVVAAVLGGSAAQVVGFVLALVAMLALAVVRREHAPDEIAKLAASPLVLGIGTVGVSVSLALTAWLTPVLARVPVREALGLRSAPLVVLVAAAVGTAGVGTVGDLLSMLAARIAPRLTFGTMEALAAIASRHPLWLVLPVLALAPGICEELFFRGMLQRALGGSTRALLLTAVAFSVYHLDPHQMAGTLPLGVYFGWLAARTGSSLSSMVAHVVNNVFALSIIRLGWFSFGYGTDHAIPAWWWLCTLIVTGGSVFVIHRRTRPSPAGGG